MIHSKEWSSYSSERMSYSLEWTGYSQERTTHSMERTRYSPERTIHSKEWANLAKAQRRRIIHRLHRLRSWEGRIGGWNPPDPAVIVAWQN